MYRARRLLCAAAALATLTAAAAANATPVTVQISGTWDSVVDNANVTNGAIAAGVSFTLTFSYDNATPDSNPDPTIGDYVLPAFNSDYVLQTGGFTFSLLPAENIIVSVGDGYLGQDDLNIFAQHFSTSGPLPAGITTGDANSSVTLVDTSATAHSSDSLTGLPWDIDDYDSPNQGMYFLIKVLGAGANKKIEGFGEITQLTVLPEPSALLLIPLVLGIAANRRLRG